MIKNGFVEKKVFNEKYMIKIEMNFMNFASDLY